MQKNTFIQESNRHYQAMLKRNAARFQTPPTIIQDVIFKGTGQPCIRLKRINGESNEIYEAALEDHTQVIVKISRKLYDFANELFISQFRQAYHIPVSRVTYIHQFIHGNEVLVLSIQDKLPGISLHELLVLPQINQRRLQSVVKTFGAMLALIHRITTKGYGRINVYGTAQGSSWKDYVLQPVQRKTALYETAQAWLVPYTHIEQTLSLLQDYSSLYEHVRPKFLYGDCSPRNILVDNYQLTGLIDFEDSFSGDPIYDLSRWDYLYDFHGFKTSLLLKGYGSDILKDPWYQTKFHLYRLRMGMDMLPYYGGSNNRLGMASALANLKKDLTYFKKYKTS